MRTALKHRWPSPGPHAASDSVQLIAPVVPLKSTVFVFVEMLAPLIAGPQFLAPPETTLFIADSWLVDATDYVPPAMNEASARRLGNAKVRRPPDGAESSARATPPALGAAGGSIRAGQAQRSHVAPRPAQFVSDVRLTARGRHAQ